MADVQWQLTRRFNFSWRSEIFEKSKQMFVPDQPYSTGEEGLIGKPFV